MTGGLGGIRPRERRWLLSRGCILNSSRYFQAPDNHWTPYASGGLDVHAIAGDHDSMVLEPYMRVRAARLRAVPDAEIERRKEVVPGLA